mmetsp:Transcript_7452/g.26084  ORF Transcript_7452/g.26084 Transcript_7452/m.26084 type:complete len:231 (+) Transcript_7452:1039-1731(+)
MDQSAHIRLDDGLAAEADLDGDTAAVLENRAVHLSYGPCRRGSLFEGEEDDAELCDAEFAKQAPLDDREARRGVGVHRLPERRNPSRRHHLRGGGCDLADLCIKAAKLPNQPPRALRRPSVLRVPQSVGGRTARAEARRAPFCDEVRDDDRGHAHVDERGAVRRGRAAAQRPRRTAEPEHRKQHAARERAAPPRAVPGESAAACRQDAAEGEHTARRRRGEAGLEAGESH